jgi:hypothetical protein
MNLSSRLMDMTPKIHRVARKVWEAEKKRVMEQLAKAQANSIGRDMMVKIVLAKIDNALITDTGPEALEAPELFLWTEINSDTKRMLVEGTFPFDRIVF